MTLQSVNSDSFMRNLWAAGWLGHGLDTGVQYHLVPESVHILCDPLKPRVTRKKALYPKTRNP